jgi:ABC-type dipeptide/oligopeptide/nickel transport system permease component
VMGVTLVYGAMLMTFNGLVDIAYGVLDPRVEAD